MSKIVFWISACSVFYVYFGYPILLALWKKLARKPIQKGEWEPSVSIVIAARNEHESIERKICNCLNLDYPADKLEIIISLDGPSNELLALVSLWTARGVKVIHSPAHRGKAAAINRAVAIATTDLIVFADVRQHIHPGAIRALTANLKDPAVGAVSGELILIDGISEMADDSRASIGLYWRYEKWIRSMESQVHSAIGATGALYAIRRELFRTIPDGTILDDVFVPMNIVLAGKRVVFEPLARAYDQVACCPQAEFPRKVRTLAGNFQLFALIPELFSPRRNPVLLQFVSHKVGRLFVPYFLVALLLSNCFLLRGFYFALFVVQILWYALAVAGWLALGSQRAQHVHKPFVLDQR